MEEIKITKDPDPVKSPVPAPAGNKTLAAPTTNLGRGHEEPSDLEDLEIPRAQVVQFTSEDAQAEVEADRRSPGSLINSITKESLGNLFVPIFKFTTFIQWNSRKKDDPNFDPAFAPGALVFSSTDRQDARVVHGIKFGPSGEPPKVTKYLNYLCYFMGQTMPLVLSFSKTSFGAGKRLNSLTQFTGGDMFSKKYKLSVKMEENAGTKYFVLGVAPAGAPTDEEFKKSEQWYNEFRGKNIKIHTDETKPEGWSE